MSRLRLVAVPLVALAAGLTPFASVAPAAAPTGRPTIAQYLKPGMPVELVSAAKADRIAWTAYEEGKRNVFTAAAPTYAPVRVTSFLKDDGIDLTDLRISSDGSTVAFVRGTSPNNQGWVANVATDPNGGERAIWVAHTATPGTATRIAASQERQFAPELSPDGQSVLYVKDGQIYRARVTPAAAPTEIDKGDRPFIDVWGVNSGPKWSPDASKIAFVSNRTDHSFIAVYDMKTRTVSYVAPSVDRDTSPTWASDSRHLIFLRRPGLPFGQQATPGQDAGLPPTAAGRNGGGGGRGAIPPPSSAVAGATGATTTATPLSPAPGAAANAGAPGGGRGRGGRNGGNGAAAGGEGGQAAGANAPASNASQPGLYSANFRGGYSLAVMIGDVTTNEAREAWHPATGDRQFSNINAIQAASDTIVFGLQPAGGRGGGGGRGAAAPAPEPGTPANDDESPRYYSLNLATAGAQPVLLTSTKGIIEDATAWTLSKDGKALFYCTNTDDIDRRHIWSVPTAGGTPKQVTMGDGIENVPVVLANGNQIAVLSSDAKRPFSVGVWPSASASPATSQKVIYPTLGPDFPMSEEVAPTNVTLKADDGVEFHSQLFLPKDMKPGEKHPALVFVHGGPARQMLLGWHYLSFYHVFYGVNEWLASKGYIVMSVNYRLGVGYGAAFRRAGNTGGARGNSEYKDVLAAGKWLAAREDVDANRVGIWGLSYGGLLTSEALARNSDIFKAGVDLAGVHLEGQSLSPDDVGYTSSAISEIDKWKSPVLLIQGDDDRNVNFAQMVGLVDLLRARDIYYELIVYPDDVHETLLHSRWLNSFAHMETFLNKFLPPNGVNGSAGK
jgi:dipeptidyl aminopeptidase/acylaminoacyl peptidase